MFRTFRRRFLPNPFEKMLKACAKKKGKRILLGWNRGLGDIALGIYPMVKKIKEIIPHAEVSILTRPDLKDGFSLLPELNVLIDPDLSRGQKINPSLSLTKLKEDPHQFDLIISSPSPTDWMGSSRGKVVPKLEWKEECLWEKFGLSNSEKYIGVQAVVETSYGKWRNWPKEHYDLLFARLDALNQKVLLLGGDEKTEFSGKNLIDLRGKTTLFDLLSIIRHKCSHLLLPDSGILSMAYYLNQNFPIHVISLWADPNHGILKQGVFSPNQELTHTPLIGESKDLSSVSVDQVMNALIPVNPLVLCKKGGEVDPNEVKNGGCILLAGGQGTRLGIKGPKGTFPIMGKSLFQWICEKAPSENFPIAVMTSPLNHDETVSFFEKHAFFGKEVYFFPQEMAPFLDGKKRETKYFAPSGNGSVFKSFVSSDLFSHFQELGVKRVVVVPVDNFLADPKDQTLLSYLEESSADVVIKCIKKEPSMGAIVERKGKLEVQEYFDLDPLLKYPLGNTGIMAISIPFIEIISRKKLPFHLVKKQIPGTRVQGYKKEQFLFDALPFGKVEALLFEKKDCFFPLKTKESLKQLSSRISLA